MSAASQAVFLSYASQDAEAAHKICEALRGASVEVWFDKNELTGGDAWDAKIRKQIAECALFVPLISAATQARREGYFRLEWRIAAQRTHMMSEQIAFLLPVVIDATRDAEADVPGEFKAVQWTRLAGGEGSEKFCARVKKLLGGSEVAQASSLPSAPDAGWKPALPPKVGRRVPAAAWVIAAIVVVGVALFLALRPSPKAGAEMRPVTAPKPAAPLSPARQLAERANTMSLKKFNSTADDFAAAEGLLKQALALDQNDAEIWAISSLFNTSIRTRGYDNSPTRREAARSQAERALKLDPNSIEGLFALGRWQRDHEPDPAVAEKTFQAVLAHSPDHEQAIGSLATLYDRSNRFEEAIAMFERAARNPRTMPLARYGQYLAYFNRWYFDEAERCLRESIAAEPSANSVTGLAMVLLTGKGDAPAAVRALADMPVANRNEHRAVWMSAFAHLAAREPEAALTALRRLSADFVQDNWFVGPTAYWIGRAHAQAGRAEAARIAFESGLAVMEAKLKAAPGDSALHVARGELLAWLGRTDEALSEARIAAELASGRDLLLWYVSPLRIYAALGRMDEALPLLEKFCARGVNRVGWPLTPALLKIDPLWDKLRGDARFQALAVEAKPVEKQSAITPAIDQKSVAVLAFANLSDDRDNAYLADSIAEELINALGAIPGLRVVVARTMSASKIKETPLPEIGRQLGVAYLLDGSVRKEREGVVITVNLIKAADGTRVWGQRYNEELKNVVDLQARIAREVAPHFQLVLEQGRSVARSAHPEAIEHYLRAQDLRWRVDFTAAQQELERALAKDDSFAPAHAALAETLVQLGFEEGYRWIPPGQPLSPRLQLALASAEKARTLDPFLADAYATLGYVRWASWRTTDAQQALRRAVDLNPNHVRALTRLARLLAEDGRFDENLMLLRQVVALEPLKSGLNGMLAVSLHLANRDAEALGVIEHAVALAPSNFGSQRWRAIILVGVGRINDGRAVALQLLQQREALPRFEEASLVAALAYCGLQKEAWDLFADLLRRSPNETSLRAYQMAALGRPVEALKWLDEMTITNVQDLFYDPSWDPVRKEARFQEFLAKRNLTAAHERAQAWRASHPPEKAAR